MSIFHALHHYNNGGYISIDETRVIYIPFDETILVIDQDIVNYQMNENLIDPEILQDIHDQLPNVIIQGIGTITRVMHRSPLLITGVLEIKSRIIYGLGAHGGRFYRFSPVEPKYPHFMVLSKLNQDQYQYNLYVAIKFVSWTLGDTYPRGSCEIIIGEIGNLNNEIMCQLYVHRLIFTNLRDKDIITEITRIQQKLDWNHRLDLTNQEIFSIDSSGCLDIDDALDITITDQKEAIIGIHLADVGEWVQPNSLLDRYAQQRMTSIYLPNQIRPMLPTILSDNLCSLLPKQLRLAVSLLLTIDLIENKIKKKQFVKSKIINHQALTYQEAEKLINHVPNSSVTKMYQIIQLIEKKSFDGTNVEAPKAHWLIETLMKLANQWCAEMLIQSRQPCPLRVQPPPINSIPDQTLNHELLTYLHIKTQQTAKYILYDPTKTQDTSHHGLHVNYYTHFTSPIRRYIDLINHRLLKSYQTEGGHGETESPPSVLGDVGIGFSYERANCINTQIKKLNNQVAYVMLVHRLEQHKNNIIQKTHGYVIKIYDKTPSVKIKVCIPEYQITKTVVILDHRLVHLHQICRTFQNLNVSDLTTSKVIFECQLYQKIGLSIVPIIKADYLDQKLRVNIS